ncbi:Polyprenyl synthetase family protein [Desulfovibrionales bacterium]
MRAFLEYMEAEQPRINAVLEAETVRLHPLVQPVVRYVLQAGGKRLRPMLALLTARTMGHAADTAYTMACSLEFLHSATLLHDDVLDDAKLRRGLPAAHIIHGLTETILAGDALLALGNQLMAEYGEPRLTSCISEAILRTTTGEIAEIAAAGNLELTEADYLDIVAGKTAYLIQAACRCGAILAGASTELEAAAATFGLNLGIAFQLVDDALDYSGTTETIGKSVGADLAEGKITLPLLLYLATLAPAQRQGLMDRSKAEAKEGHTFTSNIVIEAVAAVRATGCDLRTREVAARYLESAREALKHFPTGRESELLGLSLQYVLNREK